MLQGGRLVYNYDWRCAPVDYSMNPEAVEVAYLTWSYFIIKIVDLIDTVRLNTLLTSMYIIYIFRCFSL